MKKSDVISALEKAGIEVAKSAPEEIVTEATAKYPEDPAKYPANLLMRLDRIGRKTCLAIARPGKTPGERHALMNGALSTTPAMDLESLAQVIAVLHRQVNDEWTPSQIVLLDPIRRTSFRTLVEEIKAKTV